MKSEPVICNKGAKLLNHILHLNDMFLVTHQLVSP